MKKLIILITSALIFISCGSSQSPISKNSLNVHEIITETYQENGQFVVDEFLIREGALPQRITHLEFKNIQERSKYLKNRNENLSSGNSLFVDLDYDLVIGRKVWEVKNQWNLKWEAKYSEWIKEEFTQDFFLKHHISTDCADVAFVLRWIFARMNYLPAANTMAGSGKILSQDHFIRKWKRLKRDELWYKDEVFLAAIDYLKDTTYSKTLKKDTYPVELSKSAFREGVIQLNPTHVRVISQINYDGSGVPILKQYSTRPTGIRQMAQEVMLNFTSIAEVDGGFVKFRWPQKSKKKWKLVEAKKMKWFSKEQYKEFFLDGSVNFTKYLMNKLDIKMNARATVSSMLGAIKEFVFQRDGIVAEGYQYCLDKDCEVGTVTYDDWSTPSRDKRAVEFFDKINFVIEENLNKDPGIKDFYLELQLSTFVDLQYAQVGLNMLDIEELFRGSFLSYDPRDPIELRWARGPRMQHQALELKVKRLMDARDVLIKKAHTCRKTQKCFEGTKLFKELNTIEIDKELNKYFKGIKSLCSISEEYCLLSLHKNISNIPRFNSLPNLALVIRNGEVDLIKSLK